MTKPVKYGKIQSSGKDDDIEWRTISGAHVPIKDGELQGEVGRRIEESTSAGDEDADGTESSAATTKPPSHPDPAATGSSGNDPEEDSAQIIADNKPTTAEGSGDSGTETDKPVASPQPANPTLNIESDDGTSSDKPQSDTPLPVQATPKLSASGANPSIPNMSKANQERHKKHLEEGDSYPGMSMEEYVKKATTLARMPIGGDIDGYKGANGCIVRYDKVSKDYVKAYSTGVATMFKPKRGMQYFSDWKKIDGGVLYD